MEAYFSSYTMPRVFLLRSSSTLSGSSRHSYDAASDDITDDVADDADGRRVDVDTGDVVNNESESEMERHALEDCEGQLTLFFISL